MSISFGPGITIGPNINVNLPVLGKNSFYFDGSSSVNGPTNVTGLRMTSGTSFTAEFWVYATDISTNYQGIAQYVNPILTAGWILALGGPNGSGKIQFFQRNSGASTQIITSSPISANTWYHVALVYNGTNCHLYLNGVSQGTCNLNQLSNTTQQFFIGVYAAAQQYLNGAYVSNLRVVSGTAVYTANFTPPNGPLTEISGTQILTCNRSTIIDTSTNAWTLTTTGTVTTSDSSPF